MDYDEKLKELEKEVESLKADEANDAKYQKLLKERTMLRNAKAKREFSRKYPQIEQAKGFFSRLLAKTKKLDDFGLGIDKKEEEN